MKILLIGLGLTILVALAACTSPQSKWRRMTPIAKIMDTSRGRPNTPNVV
jgi:hypothetical protein